MNLLNRLFRRHPDFRPLFRELQPELSKRFGGSDKFHLGQIDRVIEKIKLRKELIPYAYVAFLREEDFLTMTSKSPGEWKERENQLNEFIENSPRPLGKGNFYESHEGII